MTCTAAEISSMLVFIFLEIFTIFLTLVQENDLTVL